jgi:hypothetical protein
VYKGYPNRGAYRNAVARQNGWVSYWHQRQTQAVVRAVGLRDGDSAQGRIRSRFIAGSKANPSARWRRMFVNAYDALRDLDHRRANRLGDDVQSSTSFIALPYSEQPDASIGESVVYYH